MTEPLVTFLASIDEARRSELDLPALGTTLARLFERSREAWPGVELDAEPFYRHLARHVSPHEDVVSYLDAVHAADVYLVVACLAGNARALHILDRDFLSASSPVLLRLRLPADVVEEARQVSRYRLLVASGGGAPKLADYAGVGSLRGWVRASILRAAFRVQRRPVGQVDADPTALHAIPSVGSDLEVDYLKRQYGATAREALGATFAELPVRERNLLRQYFGAKLGIDELATLYQVHRSTAAKWVSRARNALVSKTRAEIVRRLSLTDDEASSILRVIESQLRDAFEGLLA